MHSPVARALLQPRALLHHPCDTLKDLILAGHVITIRYYGFCVIKMTQSCNSGKDSLVLYRILLLLYACAYIPTGR